MLTLIRHATLDGAISGELFLGGIFVCYTLENASKAIPCGVYKLENSMSPKFKRTLPLIYGAKCASTRGIRIHRGNTKKDSSGCVLVGMGYDHVKGRLYDSAMAEQMVTAIAQNTKVLLVADV